MAVMLVVLFASAGCAQIIDIGGYSVDTNGSTDADSDSDVDSDSDSDSDSDGDTDTGIVSTNCMTDVDCGDGAFCRMDGCGGVMGECEAITSACPDLYAPVCGCDGSTYSNQCMAFSVPVSIAYDGECGMETDPFDTEIIPDTDTNSAFTVYDGGYVVSGPWHGYAIPFINGEGSNMDPVDFSGHVVGSPLCITGAIAPDVQYLSNAGIEFNLRQAFGDVLGPTAPVNPGSMLLNIGVTFDVPASVPIRVFLVGPGGDSNPEDIWCSDILNGWTGFQITGFNTQCWDPTGGGSDYNYQPIEKVRVVIQGDASEQVPFELCLDGVQLDSYVELTPEGTMVDQYASASVFRNGQNYMLLNNVFIGGGDSQDLYYLGNEFSVTRQILSSGGIISSPLAFIGNHWGQATGTSGLPMEMNDIRNIPAHFSWDATGVTGSYRVFYDLPLQQDAAENQNATAFEVLVVLDQTADVVAMGSLVQTGVEIPRAGFFDMWVGDMGTGVPLVTYVPQVMPLNGVDLDLREFILHAASANGIASGYLSSVQAGFEIFYSGGAGLAVTDLYFHVN